MVVHANALPDECLLSTFDLIPLSELLFLDQVCSRWASLLPSACTRRRTMFLILGRARLDEMHFYIPLNDSFDVSFDGRRPYFDLQRTAQEASLTIPYMLCNNTFDEFLSDGDDDNDAQGFFDSLYQISFGGTEKKFTEMARLRNARLSGQLIGYLTKLFPNVTTLGVIHTKCDANGLRSVAALLGSSWPSLSTLKIWIQTSGIDERFRDRLKEHPFDIALLKAIKNRSQSSPLQHLTLEIRDESTFKFTFPVKFLSFISQLKVVKLSLKNHRADDGEPICDIVHRFGTDQLRIISLGSLDFSFMTTVLNRKYEFTPKVGQLCAYLTFSSDEQLSDFCWRFPALTVLRIEWRPNITFTMLVTNLSSLVQLIRLKLDIHDHPPNVFALNEDQLDRLSLPSVKLLELTILKWSHLDFESLSPAVFPSVEVIILTDELWPLIDDCVFCPGLDLNIKQRCHRLFVRSLKNKFPHSRFYVVREYDQPFIDYTNFVFIEEGGDDQPEEEDSVEQEEEDGVDEA